MSGTLRPPLGDAVSLWGKRRIVELRREGCEQPAIASQLGVSCSTVKRVLGEAGEDGDVSAPRQGAGKLNDSRWIFAGPRGPGNLMLLEHLREARDDAEQYCEMHGAVCDTFDEPSPAYSTMTRALRTQLDYRGNMRLSSCAAERDEVRCLSWHNETITCFTPAQMVCCDES